MSNERIVLKGVAGLFQGEQYLIGPGVSLVVGRSRSCNASVVRTPSYKRVGGRALNHSRGFLRMSRRHFEVAYEDGGVLRVRDLSTNGIEVDGLAVRESVFSLDDLKSKKVSIRFADGEVMELGCADPDAADSGVERNLQEISPSSGMRL